ncbi:MAG: hypothetical protein HQL11_04115, partial [Candidatus Omnitrophica bacterium]|nr:hypothetical protein [Candidatus Omnitrophota bacterium]
GNVIGGVVFEWMDEWWKSSNGPPDRHDVKPDMVFPFPDGYSQEEWLGIAGQGFGKHTPFQRELRQAYDQIREMWASPPVEGPLALAKKEGSFSWDGVIERIDYETGELVLSVETHASQPEVLIKLVVDPGLAEIEDTAWNELQFRHLFAQDYVSVDGRVKDGELVVDSIYLYAVRPVGDGIADVRHQGY